jgi:predicted metalloprotease with PDZ domain
MLVGPIRGSEAPGKAAAHPSEPILLTVDAADVARKIVLSKLIIPAKPGPLTLVYPKWIPGTHGPNGPVGNLGGLKVSAVGKPVPWKRNSLDRFAFEIDVPAGANSVVVELAYVPPARPEALEISLGVAASRTVAALNFNALVLYPQGAAADDVIFDASVQLPDGWKFGTALEVAKQSGNTTHFKPVSLTRLIDSPILAGAYFRLFPLRVPNGPLHQIDLAGETPAALDLAPELVARMGRLATESGALFGAYHYRQFHYLLGLSDQIPAFGLEHHECSMNTAKAMAGRDAHDWWLTFLLAHEYTHSWDGKYRRPIGLAPRDYQETQSTDLLWVYEGLTQYLGLLLDTRSGLWTKQMFLDEMAGKASELDRPFGRTWRPLIDTAIAAPLHRSAGGRSWRGSSDYYYEGALIWLEADVLIRQKSQGRRSLDDFCKSFFGGKGGTPEVKTYTLDDVVSALYDIVEFDWKAFFASRLSSTASRAPLGGLEGSGWRLVYETRNKGPRGDFSFSLGMFVNTDGSVREVLHGTPAAKAGIFPGMKIVAINKQQWATEKLQEAVTASKNPAVNIEVEVMDGETRKNYRIDYHGGERFPHLERDPARLDLLEQILKPLTKENGNAR